MTVNQIVIAYIIGSILAGLLLGRVLFGRRSRHRDLIPDPDWDPKQHYGEDDA